MTKEKIIEVPEWNGEGLPPVGTKCEMLEDKSDDWWTEGIVKYIGNWLCVFDDGSIERSFRIDLVKFRPLATPEMIEAAYDLYLTQKTNHSNLLKFNDFKMREYKSWLLVVRKTNYKIK